MTMEPVAVEPESSEMKVRSLSGHYVSIGSNKSDDVDITIDQLLATYDVAAELSYEVLSRHRRELLGKAAPWYKWNK